ncbi:PLC-like phosphodiesterase [Massariosphaeria phaeospora]|uniref:PLC-like phosphodiesterase n=1 Tax=Massariosphaeria phaeospora TaxID=100035 RepID=A0A7C8MIB4_9PLEO|nr:PLC-like phosphodiesterase [Massariosphaeria phaeospora]
MQLSAGVRLLSAQVHVAKNENTKQRELHLCHSSCFFMDAGLLQDWLFEIRTWMDRNPDGVVTLVLVNMGGIDARELEGEYARADIARYGYVPETIDKPLALSNETFQTWPTLAQMIEKKGRLVTFVNPLKPDKQNAPYLLNEFDFVWENAYEVIEPTGFTCHPDRPANKTIAEMRDSGRLFLMNHILYWQQAFGIQLPDLRHINTTNSWDGLGGLGLHMMECGHQVSRRPTFVLVDFFNVGPAIEAVDILNDVQNPVGRKNVTATVVEEHIAAGASMPVPRRILVASALAVGAWNLLA